MPAADSLGAAHYDAARRTPEQLALLLLQLLATGWGELGIEVREHKVFVLRRVESIKVTIDLTGQ